MPLVRRGRQTRRQKYLHGLTPSSAPCKVKKYNYFNLESAVLIFANPFSIFSMLFAKDRRIQLDSPNAFPVTVETCALFNRYIQRSSAFSIVSSPSDFPKYLFTSGKT